MHLHELITQDQQVAEQCRRYGVHRFSQFGSVLRDDFGSESDVDLLAVMLKYDASTGWCWPQYATANLPTAPLRVTT